MKYSTVTIATICTFFFASIIHAQSAIDPAATATNETIINLPDGNIIDVDVKHNQVLSEQIQKVDALFSAWNKPDTPGAALAVIKDGKIIYSHGYGMADLERNASITPTTVFQIASMSKQFTAFAIQLLVQERKLSLDDDIRKFLPELHDFGKTITVRHLLHHTSGLRNYSDLMLLAGWRSDDVTTEDDIFNLIWAQKELNFQPGKKMLYCNTGYTLLGEIVKRVSGRSLAIFTKEKIFDPLGMHNTHFQEDYGTIVKNRASSYQPGVDEKYQYLALSFSSVGSTNLFTTVEDLALWDQNFYNGKVGGAALVAQMLQTGTLNNGKKLDYASGLVIGKYRGLNTVDHSGAHAGFRSNLLRFPDQHFSVVILSNTAEFAPYYLTQKVADVFLSSLPEFKPQEPQAQQALKKVPFTEIKMDPSKLDPFVGDYALSPEHVISMTREGNQLMVQALGQEKFPIFPATKRTFFIKAFDAQFTFDSPDKNGKVNGGVLHEGGNDQVAKKIILPKLSSNEVNARKGEFYSDELHVLYTIIEDDGKLVLIHPRGKIHLKQITSRSFYGDNVIGKLKYTCITDNACNSFAMSNSRTHNVKFYKVNVETVATDEEKATIAAQAAAEEDAIPPFKTVPVYLRGSMNQWGLRDQMRATGNNLFHVNIVLKKGVYQFKVGSDDFTKIDFGTLSSDESSNWAKTNKMEAVGENFSLDVTKQATYSFTLDATDPRAPTISVKIISRK